VIKPKYRENEDSSDEEVMMRRGKVRDDKIRMKAERFLTKLKY